MYAVSGLILYVVLTGLLGACYVVERNEVAPGSRRLQLLMLSTLFGLVINLSLVLLLRSLWLSFAAGAVLAGTGLIYAYRNRAFLAADAAPVTSVFNGVLLVIFVGVAVYASFYNPLASWDARSLWFFHGKMIFYAGGLFESGGWSTIPADYHADYPLLVPVLAAEVAALVGYWNEFIPLTSLAILFVAEAIVMAYLFREPLQLALFFGLVASWGGFSPYFLNGYIDVHLAFFGCFALCAWQRVLDDAQDIDVVVAVLCCSVMACLKNEGIVFAAIITSIAMAGCGVKLARTKIPAAPVHLFAIFCLALLPIVTWKILCIVWSIRPNDLMTNGLWDRLKHRADSATIETILSAMSVRAIFFCSALATCAGVARDRQRAIALLFPLLCLLIYAGVLVLIYLSTPYDLKWHLETSADRVAFALSIGLAGSIAILAGGRTPVLNPAPD